MRVGEALHFGRHFVDARRLGKFASGSHITLVAFLVLRIVLVRHLLAEQHPPESFDIHILDDLVVAFRFLLDVLVQQRAPVHDKQPVRVVVRSRHTFELSRCNQFTHEDIAAAFDTLSPVISELHVLLVKGDAVAKDGEYRARTQDIGVESSFLQGVVLCQSRFIHQVHRFLHRVADVFVVRRKGEEVVVDFLYVVT